MEGESGDSDDRLACMWNKASVKDSNLDSKYRVMYSK